MNLVGYSDSEGSDNESPTTSTPAAASAPKTATKLVDPSTNKIRVNLASLGGNSGASEEIKVRPAKRQRTGGGLNINAFLPPPKQPSRQLNNAASDAAARRAPGRGLGKGVNLKTGAEPAFTRLESSSLDLDGEPKDIKEVIAELRRNRPSPSNGPSKVDGITSEESVPPQKEVKLVGNAMRFRPMSVARNAPKKKKPAAPTASTALAVAGSVDEDTVSTKFIGSANKLTTPFNVPPKSKPSLFSLGQPGPDDSGAGGADIQDMPDTEMIHEEEPQHLSYQNTAVQDSNTPSQQVAPVDNLNLSAADMRQLFGRKAGKGGHVPDLSSINMVNFNADAEYAANEELRAKGDTITHNPVRALAPGKHSLKQLVNAAATQADALEEHFAMGKRNQKETGSKYGW